MFKGYEGYVSGELMVKALKRIATIGVVALMAVAVMGVSWQAVAEKQDQRKFPPPGELVDIGGYRLHMLKTGKDTTNNKKPVVVLEAGLGCTHQDWTHVQKELSKETTVISYDRAGYGFWSEWSPFPRTSLNEVDELMKLLEKSGTKGPYILVGHSFGGFNVRLFAMRYPEQVAGIVFVDSTHEEQESKETPNGFEYLYASGNPDWGRLLTRIGATRFFLPASAVSDTLPEEIRQSYLAILKSQSFAGVQADETALFEQSGQQIQNIERNFPGYPLGDIPVVVLTAGPSPDNGGDAKWASFHEHLAKKTTRGEHLYTGTEYEHMVPWHEPEKVVEAVRKIFTQL